MISLRRLTWLFLASTMAVTALVVGAACGDDDDDDAGNSSPSPEPTAGVVEMSAETALHHWEALAAIEAGDIDDARDHVQHILDAVTADATHMQGMRDVLAALDAGDLGEAEHGVEEMLAGRADPGLTREMLHLQMALTALEHEDTDDASHHMDHFLGLRPEDADAEEVRSLMADGRHDEAMGRLEGMIAAMAGEMPGMDMDDDADHVGEIEADRDVTVIMTEFAFEPAEIRAKIGERVRLIAVNRGAVLHDITAEEFAGEVQTSSEGAEHESTADADHGDADSFHVAVNAGETADLVFEPTAAGEYELFCTVPGHRQLGMIARLIVE